MNRETSHQDYSRFIVLFVTLLTGATGLMYEITWHRYLANLLGSQARATSTILAVFLGGLCVGYFAFGRMSKRASPRHTVALAGIVEIGIGLWALMFPSMYSLVWGAFHSIPSPSKLIEALLDVLTASLLMGPPTVLMGATLPLLTKGLAKTVAASSATHAKIYSLNTLGAFVGAIACGFFFLPSIGVRRTIIAAAITNLAAGLVLLLCARLIHGQREAEPATKMIAIEQPRISVLRASVLAFMCGTASLTVQVVLVRLVGLSIGASEYAFTMVVGAFVFILAAGAFAHTKLKLTTTSLCVNQSVSLATLLALFVSVPAWPYFAHVLRTILSNTLPAFYAYYLGCFVVLTTCLALPVGTMGRVMPLLFSMVDRTNDNMGERVGRLYSWNTIGNVSGALVGGYLALFVADLQHVFLGAMILVVGSVVLSVPSGNSRSWVPSAVAATICLAGVGSAVIFFPWDDRSLAFGTFRNRAALSYSYSGADEFYSRIHRNYELEEYSDGPNTTVAVFSLTDTSNISYPVYPIARFLTTNAKTEGTTHSNDLRTTRLLAHLPALFSPSDRARIAVIGYGTGITAGTLTLFDSVQQVDCFEISPEVFRVAHWFDFASHGASTNPKINQIVGDAYRILTTSDIKYDIIISEPSNPWVTGVERLFTKEFYNLVIDRLSDDGMYAQWVQAYEISEESMGLIVNTFSRAFANSYVFSLGRRDLLFLASNKELNKTDIERMERRFHLEAISNSLSEVGVESPAGLLALELSLPVAEFSDYGIQSLLEPKLSYRAGVDHFRNLSFSLDRYWESRYRRTHGAAAFSKTNLFSTYLRTATDAVGATSDFAKERCRHLDTGGPIEQEALSCRQAIAVLSLSDESIAHYEPGVENLAMLKGLCAPQYTACSTEHVPLRTVVESERFLELAFEFNSVFFPIDAESLLKAVEPCYRGESNDHLRCRETVIDVLIHSGEYTAATAQFQYLLNDYGPRVSASRIGGFVHVLSGIPGSGLAPAAIESNTN